MLTCKSDCPFRKLTLSKTVVRGWLNQNPEVEMADVDSSCVVRFCRDFVQHSINRTFLPTGKALSLIVSKRAYVREENEFLSS